MSCQSGIKADGELLKFLNACKCEEVRLAKIVVKNEQLCVNFQDKGTNDWRNDFKRHLPNCIDAFEPCFILFRIDGPTGWLLISFADDRAPVREKMVLAATRTTFKCEFGPSNIRYEYHVTNKKDMCLESFETWISGKFEPGPMSVLEKEIDNAHREKVISPAAQTMKGIYFPVDQDAEVELRKLVSGKTNYVQLAVDTLNEAIKLESSMVLSSASELKSVIPGDKPRYHFYRFLHNDDQNDYNVLFFIYSMPSSGCTIKERMLYSSCKQPFLKSFETLAGIQPDKKIEIDSKDSLSLELLKSYIQPLEADQKIGFARPPGPPQRGRNRVTKD